MATKDPPQFLPLYPKSDWGATMDLFEFDTETGLVVNLIDGPISGYLSATDDLRTEANATMSITPVFAYTNVGPTWSVAIDAVQLVPATLKAAFPNDECWLMAYKSGDFKGSLRLSIAYTHPVKVVASS